jgi:hypothetical protein
MHDPEEINDQTHISINFCLRDSFTEFDCRWYSQAQPLLGISFPSLQKVEVSEQQKNC